MYSVAIKKEQCPRCAAKGRDTKGDNLAVYNDGHKYCYGCGLYFPPKLSDRLNKDTNQHYGHKPISTPNLPLVSDLPSVALKWLLRYNITPEEIKKHKIVWNPNNECLVFPIYQGDILKATNERYFGNNPKYPRYKTSGNKTYLPILEPSQSSTVYILCEDYVSAIKISRQYNAVPLFGSTVPNSVFIALLRFHPVLRLWLDNDKASEAAKAAQRGRQWIADCGTILSLSDPKCYTDSEVKDFVNRTLSNPKSVS